MARVEFADGSIREVEWCGLTPGVLSISLLDADDILYETIFFTDKAHTSKIVSYGRYSSEPLSTYIGYTDLIFVKRTPEANTILVSLAYEEGGSADEQSGDQGEASATGDDA